MVIAKFVEGLLILILLAAESIHGGFLGIDVSHNNGNINWARVRASGIRVAFMKATESSSFRDPLFKNNWNMAMRFGIRIGAYHFYNPTVPFSNQCANFAQTLEQVTINGSVFGLAVDVEKPFPSNGLKYSDGVYNFIQCVRKRYSRIPFYVYTYASFWNKYISWGAHDFSRYYLWVAHYGVPRPNVPRNWTSWKIWQFSSKGKVPGINGFVDLNHFN